MNEFSAEAKPADTIPVIKNYEGFGELVVGRSKEGYVLFVSLCMLNNPTVNQFLLDNNVRFMDRITKTMIFPREGMALPNGQIFSAPAENEEKK